MFKLPVLKLPSKIYVYGFSVSQTTHGRFNVIAIEGLKFDAYPLVEDGSE